MLTYENYMTQKMGFDDQMRDTQHRESEAVKVLEEERQQSNSQLFEEFLEAKRRNNQEYAERIMDERNKFKTERRQIWEKQNILTVTWRAQLLKLESGEVTNEQIYGITPPDGGGQHKIGG